jgi:hypothetical protein
MPASWFLVGPDATLRGRRSARTAQTPAPPPLRMLSDAQMQRLWELTRDVTVLGDAAIEDSDLQQPAIIPVPDEDAVLTSAPLRESRGAMLSWSADGRRRTVVVLPQTTAWPTVRALWSELHALGWGQATRDEGAR